MEIDDTPRRDVSEKSSLVALTAEIVSAYLSNNAVRTADVPTLLASVHGALAGLGSTSSTPEPVAEKPTPAVSIKKSVTDDYLVCLNDGKKFVSLKRHLSVLGMTPEDYRAKWNLPKDYPMVAPAYAKKRSDLAKTIGLGQKGRKAAAAEPSPEAPARKRGRAKAA